MPRGVRCRGRATLSALLGLEWILHSQRTVHLIFRHRSPTFCSLPKWPGGQALNCTFIFHFLRCTSVSGWYRCFLCGPTAEQLLVFACQTVARSVAGSHSSGNLALAQRIAPLTAGTLAPVWLWPYGHQQEAAVTRNVPGKVPITDHSSEKPTFTVNTAVVWRSLACAKQPFVSFIFSGYLQTVTVEAS